MRKKDFLRKKYEHINKLKTLVQETPKENIDSVLNSINKVCDNITKYLESKAYEFNNKSDKKKETNKGKINKGKKDEVYEKTERIFTIKELLEFNGQNGNPPYIAINDIVYDLTYIKKWKNGKHHGILAGQVLTEEYNKFHGDRIDLIKKARVVGVLAVDKRTSIFTKEELEKYDGVGGKPAYVAVDGIIYDVSKILQWQGGSHYGLKAGRDLTTYYQGCHSNNLDAIKNAQQVGILKSED